MAQFPITHVSKGEFHLICYLIRLNALQQALSRIPKTSRHYSRLSVTAQALSDLESFILLLSGKPLRSVILSIVSDPLHKWIETTIRETETTAGSSYLLEYIHGHLSALIKYGKKAAKLLPEAERYRLLKLLARVNTGADLRILNHEDLEDDFERDFLIAIEDVVEKSWSQFAPISRDSWRSLPSMVDALVHGKDYVRSKALLHQMHDGRISTAA